jgi:uncharacterized protein YggE
MENPVVSAQPYPLISAEPLESPMNKLVVLILSCCMAFGAVAADLPNFPFVVANGSAQKKIKPDLATVHLTITAFDKDSDQALKIVNLTTTQVSEIVTRHGVRKENIEATDINKSTTRRRDPEFNALEILGYEVTRSMTIKIDNLAQYPEIMGNLIATNHVSGVRAEFDMTNRKTVEAELIAEAGADAREKAAAMASGLGCKIQSVFAISQVSSFGDFAAGFGGGAMRSVAFKTAEGSYETVMFAPETITVEQTVNVMFRIK